MRKSTYVAALVLFWLAFSPAARSEDQEATHVVVTVIDPSGAVVPGAEVWIGRMSDSLKPFLIANDRGVLTADINPGKYEIDVQFPGFHAHRQGLTVLEIAEQHVNVTLQIISCSECVVVMGMPVPEPAVPLPSPSVNEAPSECRRDSNVPNVGFPVLSKTNRGLYYGISLPQNHVVAPSPVPLYIWVDNTNDQDANAPSGCDLVLNAGIHLRSVRGRGLSKRKSVPRSQICSVQIPVRIPAHSCFAFAKVDLSDIYELHSGVYSVVAGKQDGERRGGAEQKEFLLFQYQALVPAL
jgi:hypothetical protein